jgi:hypothetical protein
LAPLHSTELAARGLLTLGLESKVSAKTLNTYLNGDPEQRFMRFGPGLRRFARYPPEAQE